VCDHVANLVGEAPFLVNVTIHVTFLFDWKVSPFEDNVKFVSEAPTPFVVLGGCDFPMFMWGLQLREVSPFLKILRSATFFFVYLGS